MLSEEQILKKIEEVELQTAQMVAINNNLMQILLESRENVLRPLIGYWFKGKFFATFEELTAEHFAISGTWFAPTSSDGEVEIIWNIVNSGRCGKVLLKDLLGALS